MLRVAFSELCFSLKASIAGFGCNQYLMINLEAGADEMSKGMSVSLSLVVGAT